MSKPRQHRDPQGQRLPPPRDPAVRVSSSILSLSFPGPAPRSMPGGTGSAARSSPSPRPCCLFLFGTPLSPVPGPCCPSPGPRDPCSLSLVRAARSSPGPDSPPSQVRAARSYPDPRSASFLPGLPVPGPCCPLLPGTPRSPGAPAAPGAVSPELPPVLLPRSTLRSNGSSSPWPCSGTTRCPWSYCREDYFSQKNNKKKENSRLPARQTRSCSNLCFVFSAL